MELTRLSSAPGILVGCSLAAGVEIHRPGREVITVTPQVLGIIPYDVAVVSDTEFYAVGHQRGGNPGAILVVRVRVGLSVSVVSTAVAAQEAKPTDTVSRSVLGVYYYAAGGLRRVIAGHVARPRPGMPGTPVTWLATFDVIDDTSHRAMGSVAMDIDASEAALGYGALVGDGVLHLVHPGGIRRVDVSTPAAQYQTGALAMTPSGSAPNRTSRVAVGAGLVAWTARGVVYASNASGVVAASNYEATAAQGVFVDTDGLIYASQPPSSAMGLGPEVEVYRHNGSTALERVRTLKPNRFVSDIVAYEGTIVGATTSGAEGLATAAPTIAAPLPPPVPAAPQMVLIVSGGVAYSLAVGAYSMQGGQLRATVSGTATRG